MLFPNWCTGGSARLFGGAPANADTHYAEDVAQAVFTDLARKRLPWRTTRFSSAGSIAAPTSRPRTSWRAELSRSRREKEAHLMQEIMASDGPAPEWEKSRPCWIRS